VGTLKTYEFDLKGMWFKGNGGKGSLKRVGEIRNILLEVGKMGDPKHGEFSKQDS
jgi:hypothetical protein